MIVHLDVIGTPEPQGNKTAFSRGGKTVVLEGKTEDARARFKSWREAVAQAARDWQAVHRQPLLDGPLEVVITFRLPKPKSAPKSRRFPDTKPDLDKLDRAVLDALTGVLIVNDSRVVLIHSRKVFAVDGPPGAAIEVRHADDDGEAA